MQHNYVAQLKLQCFQIHGEGKLRQAIIVHSRRNSGWHKISRIPIDVLDQQRAGMKCQDIWS